MLTRDHALPDQTEVSAKPAVLDVTAAVYDLWLSSWPADAISRRLNLPLAAVHAVIEARLALQRAHIALRIAAKSTSSGTPVKS